MIVFKMTANVSDTGEMNVWTEPNHSASFAQVLEAMKRIRDDLDRQISAGPTVCPFRNK